MSRADHRAFEILVRQHHRRLLAFALSLTHSPQAAEDVVQEAFVTAYKRLPQFDPARDFGSWVRGIIRHKYMEWARKQRTKPIDGKVLDSLEDSHREWDRAEAEERGEALAALRRCLGALEAASREIVDLFYMKRQPCATVAARLGVTETVVRKRLERARRRLARCVGRRLGGAPAGLKVEPGGLN
jgi:RNA polymerase sigma-70 factor (ECF subfamily)